MKKIELGPGNKILVINIGGIGDQVMALPALQYLHEAYPHCALSLLTIGRGDDISKQLSFIQQRYKFNIIYGNPLSYIRWDIIKLLFHLRAQRFSLAVNLEGIFSFAGKWKMQLLFFVLGARYRAGRNTNNRGRFYHIKLVEEEVDKRHTVELMIDVVRSITGMSLPYIFPALRPVQEREIFIENYIKDNKIINKTVIGLNPGSQLLSHRWAPENFIQLALLLQEHYDVWIAVTGGLSDASLVQHITQKIKRNVLIEPSRSISDFISFVKRCAVFVTSDTGPMHIAAAVGTPIVALFGPMDPERFGPYMDIKKHTIIKKAVPCKRPCYKPTCSDVQCMNTITVDEVFNAVRKFIG